MQKMAELKERAEITNGVTYIGPCRFINGHRIVLYQSPKTEKAIAIYCRNGAVLRINDTFGLKDLKDLQNIKQFHKTVGLFIKWTGFKTIPKKYCYKGQMSFQHQQGCGSEWKSQGYSGSEQFYEGQFRYGIRHGKGKLWRNSKKYEGEWIRGLMQGAVVVDGKDKFWYINDMELGPYSKQIEQKHPINRQIEPFYSEMARYGQEVTPKLVSSLQGTNWLSSSAVDFFMAHLEYAFLNHPKKHKQVLINRVQTYQKMASSSSISNSKYINYQEVKKNGEAYKDLTSIFFKYPLIIFPYNSNMSHFALAYIKSKISYRDGYLQKVEFELGQLDPLGHSNPNMHHQMASYITQEIITNIHQAERNIYIDGLNSAQEGTSGRKSLPTFGRTVSTQPNFFDCGIYTCAYAFLLVLEEGLGEKVKWNFTGQKQQEKSLSYYLRQFMFLDACYGIVNLFQVLKKILDC